MRRLMMGSLALLALGGLIAVGCGSSDVDETGSSSTSTSGGGVGGTETGGGGTGGGTTGDCLEVTTDDFAYLGQSMWGVPFYYGGDTTPPLGGDLTDSLYFYAYDPELTGTIDLGAGEEASFATCTACVLIVEDQPEEGDPARLYFQQSGTVDLGTTTPYYLGGSLTDVTLVEVTIDGETGESTPVPGGQCLHITNLTFDIQPPTDGWECDPSYYDAGAEDYCDCECGAVDPDCDIAEIEIYGCYEGQTCDSSAECEGLPTAWTCDGNAFEDGTTCDCGCGVLDPDCEIPNAPVTGCDSGTTCNLDYGTCIPDGWTCEPGYYGATDGCDCNCGAVDPDCADPEATVYGCDESNHTGVCLPDGTCQES